MLHPDILQTIWSLLDHIDKLVIKDKIINDRKTCILYVQYGYLKLLRQILHNSNRISYYCLFDYAAFYGHIHILQWAHDNSDHWRGPNIFMLAIENGQLEVIQWLTKHKFIMYTGMCEYAASNGHLHILQ